MEIQTAEYRGSYPSVALCPKDGKPEYAFIGRSNVGKSSLINMLLGRKELAHTSGKPGKTQLLNYYLINNDWYVVDLPGYGYAKVSKGKRQEWERMIHTFLQTRGPLVCTFVLIDLNVTPQENDLQFINWLGESQIPFVLVYTKTDRLKPDERDSNQEAFQQALLESWSALPQEFVTSAQEKTGRNEMLQFIEAVNGRYQQQVGFRKHPSK